MLSFILFSKHHFSIILMALVNVGLQSAIMAMSSAKTMTFRPIIKLNFTTRSFMNELKKKGLVLLPWGHPLFKLIASLFSLILILATESNHKAIRSSLRWCLSVLFSNLISIEWSILSKAFFRSKRATQEQHPSFYLNFKKLISLYKWTSHPYSGTNPS